MKVAKKLNNFLINKDIQKKDFAELIGVTANYFSQILRGTHPIPVKCWERIIKFTDGYITITELMKEKIKATEQLEVMAEDNPFECKVKIKGKI